MHCVYSLLLFLTCPNTLLAASLMSNSLTGQQIEAEGLDRSDLSWPGYQLTLLQDAVSAG